jgi:hypothetical protein
MDRTVVIWAMFLILTLGLVNMAPPIFIDGVDYRPDSVHLPDAFDAWAHLPGYETINLALVNGDFTDYIFDSLEVDARIRVLFNRFNESEIEIFTARADTTFWGYDSRPFDPVIGKNDLLAVWNPDENSSIIDFAHAKGRVTGIFVDTNATRNDIDQAFDDRELNCTIAITGDWADDDDLGAREIVVALLTFNLDSVFRDINPVLGFMMSATIMIPTLFVFFSVIMWALHGE